MPINILMPALSPTMTEGNLAKWLKKEGDNISAGEVIAEIETDKATMEVEAVEEGVLAKILVQAGTENVLVNDLIAVIMEDDEKIEDVDKYIKSYSSSAQAPAEAIPSADSKPELLAPKIEQVQAVKQQVQNSVERIFASPLAKRIAEQKNIDLRNITGSGPNGRIVKADMLNVTKSSSAQHGIINRNNQEYIAIPNNNIRKIIARRLTESKQQVPHFYLSIECCLENLLEMRGAMNDAVRETGEYKLSVNDFIIKAAALALRDVPTANSSWSDEAILRYNNVDIAVAVAIEDGLITPIIKNADMKTISQISNEMKDLAARARANKLAPEEFQGGSFSISNLGMYGIKKFSAIINPPQSCILALGGGTKRPIIDGNDNMVAATMMDATLSCDHRVVDGAVGAELLAVFKKYIEHPVLMFV